MKTHSQVHFFILQHHLMYKHVHRLIWNHVKSDVKKTKALVSTEKSFKSINSSFFSCDEGEILSQFRQSLLEAQNDYRRQHGARPLSLCPILSKEAQDWATHLISINALKNSGKGHGETMSYKWTSNMVPPTGKLVIPPKWVCLRPIAHQLK